MDSGVDELLDVVNFKVVLPPDIVDILELEEGTFVTYRTVDGITRLNT